MFIPPLHTALPNNTTLPFFLLYRGLSPHNAPLSIGFSSLLYYNFVLPLELFLVRSPLLKKSKFVSSPVLNDMLKFRTYSCIAASLQTFGMRQIYRILYVGPRLGNLSILYMSWQFLILIDLIMINWLAQQLNCEIFNFSRTAPNPKIVNMRCPITMK